ncbi:MAG: hypothetical protein HY840_07345 [Bacteroidetes bacterium]|nr:hypothetical protein [Bacteroidota bacterium]
MTLDRDEYQEFLKTHLALLYFVGQNEKIIPAGTDVNKFIKLGTQIKFKCREKLFENMELLEEYLKSRVDSLTLDQIKILEGFKKKIKSNFVIFKCLARHAVFIDTADNKIYAVKALGDRFDEFFSRFPALCHTAIIPFKDKIIYDGFIQSKGIYYGPNMTSEMNEEYKQAKADKTIITTIL